MIQAIAALLQGFLANAALRVLAMKYFLRLLVLIVVPLAIMTAPNSEVSTS